MKKYPTYDDPNTLFAGFSSYLLQKSGFPRLPDIPICKVCGSRLTLGEWPVYDWECPNGPHFKDASAV